MDREGEEVADALLVREKRKSFANNSSKMRRTALLGVDEYRPSSSLFFLLLPSHNAVVLGTRVGNRERGMA